MPWALLPGRAPWQRLVLILLGGLALNFTPCILPMIPINLAIIGAGAQSGSRRRGFALGTAYGAGMALAYGSLGLVVVLTGAKFGTLNSSPWFNFAIAAVFIVLSLAMFDRIVIDLSRFQRTGTPGKNRGAFIAAPTMGMISALLAGACVAPVVISVLLLATTQYQRGNFSGPAASIRSRPRHGIALAICRCRPFIFAQAGHLDDPGRNMVSASSSWSSPPGMAGSG